MNTAKIFTTGRSQAVRLPKSFRFVAREVRIEKIHNQVVLSAIDSSWNELVKAIKAVPSGPSFDHLFEPPKDLPPKDLA